MPWSATSIRSWGGMLDSPALDVFNKFLFCPQHVLQAVVLLPVRMDITEEQILMAANLVHAVCILIVGFFMTIIIFYIY